jgi:hypothetical protein
MTHLVAKGRLLKWNVLVLASLQNLLMDAVQADGIWIWLPVENVIQLFSSALMLQMSNSEC